MKKLGRREFLYGLGAGAALAGLRPGAWGEFLDSRPGSQNSYTLNVVIHGMFVVDVRGKGVTLYPPISHQGHDYLAGTWLKEQAIAKGERLALNVSQSPGQPAAGPPEAKLQPTENPVFPGGSLHTEYSHFRFFLPYPNGYSFLRLAHQIGSAPFFTGTPQPYVQPHAIPEVVVFTYQRLQSLPSIQRVFSAPPVAEFPWTPDVQGGYINLHIWAMEPGAPDPAMFRKRFAVLKQLTGFSNLHANSAYYNAGMPLVDKKTGVPGLTPDQEHTLFERTKNGEHPKAPCCKTKPPVSCSSIFLY